MYKQREKTSLILEGGGMRGSYTAGVLDCFLNRNLEFDTVYGVSAGACNATSFLSKQPYRNEKIIYHYSGDEKYMGISNYVKTGSFFGMDMMFHQIPEEILPFDYLAFEKNAKNFQVVVTNCFNGKAEYFKVDKLDDENLKALQATMSLPYISNMINIGNIPYLDGGIADSIPIRKSIRDRHDKHVVVLTRSENYRKKFNPRLHFLNRRFYKSYPELCKAIESRYFYYNNTLELLSYLEKRNLCFIIRPSEEMEVGRVETDKDKLLRLYELGYRDAAGEFSRLQEYLQDHKERGRNG